MREPQCAREGNALEWWIEPDVIGPPRDPNYHTPPQWRIDQTRGKILCYECPFLADCRKLSWGEPANIWAGLDYKERYDAQLNGHVAIKVPKYVNTYDEHSQRSIIKKRFILGESLDEIAASMDRSTSAIWYHIRRVLVQARLEQEGTLWSLAPAPPLPSGMSRPRFRHGAACSYNSEALFPESEFS